MLGTILTWLTSSAASTITEKLIETYELKLKATTDEKKLEADLIIARLEAQQGILLAEQGRWYTAWIRPMLALPVVIFVWKILVYDTVLQLDVTPNPGEFVRWIVTVVIGAYFLTRPFEKIFKRK